MKIITQYFIDCARQAKLFIFHHIHQKLNCNALKTNTQITKCIHRHCVPGQKVVMSQMGVADSQSGWFNILARGGVTAGSPHMHGQFHIIKTVVSSMIPVQVPLDQKTAGGQLNPNLNQKVNTSNSIIKTGISGSISCLIATDMYVTWYPRYD